ncbi:MAG TPA: hypothetical protein VMV73_05050, partial [Candidatus Dormibacteraeota bacterium]|nr:hypothetical protein [Candidatus Dormibacteraeota bacterium]
MVVALGIAAAPNPIPAASPLPHLKLIIELHSTSALCGNFVTHANGAIASDNRNDVALGNVVASLRHRDINHNILSWERGIQYFNAEAVAINTDWANGEREVNQLRALSATTKDPQEKKSLMDSANALGGALWRQRKIARDLQGFVAQLQGEQGVRETNQQVSDAIGSQMMANSAIANSGPNALGAIYAKGGISSVTSQDLGTHDAFANDQIDP